MRTKIVHEALSWIGTPYVEQARVKGVGVDCAMLVAGIAINLGLISDKLNIEPYDIQYHLHNREEKLLSILEGFGCIRKSEGQVGDILAFRFGRSCSHLGVLIDNQQFIHAKYDMPNPRVVSNILGGEYLPRLQAIYSFPGVE